jgi:hypothetical protein
METGMESDVSDHLDHEEMYLMLQADMVNSNEIFILNLALIGSVVLEKKIKM